MRLKVSDLPESGKATGSSVAFASNRFAIHSDDNAPITCRPRP